MLTLTDAARKELEEALQGAVRERQFERAAELRDKMQHLAKPSVRSRNVNASDIAWVVSQRTGIPVGRLTAGERERLLELEGADLRRQGRPAAEGIYTASMK